MTTFKISADYDIRLLPFSPVSEMDELEIRVQGKNDGESGKVLVTFKIDDEIIKSEEIFVEKNNMGFAKCKVPMKGRAGKHKIYINDACCELEVLEKPLPILDGGFAMIGPPNDRIPCDSFRDDLKKFTDDDWAKYMDCMADIGCRCIVFHNCQEYSIYNNFKPDPKDLTAHYPSKIYPKSDILANDPIVVVLKKAEEYGMQVFLSVGNCYGHTALDEDFYELYELYGNYKSFYGWYLSNELNLKVFKEEGWEIQKHQTEVVRKISPVKPVLVSPFDFPCKEVLEYMKNNDVFDIMMPQDCVGQERLNIEQSHEMHKILKEVCTKADKHLWANCEAFNFKDGVLLPRYKNGGMHGDSGFFKQIEIVRPYVEKIMCFAYTGFFTPSGFAIKLGGDLAVKQYEEYFKYYKTKREIQ